MKSPKSLKDYTGECEANPSILIIFLTCRLKEFGAAGSSHVALALAHSKAFQPLIIPMIRIRRAISGG